MIIRSNIGITRKNLIKSNWLSNKVLERYRLLGTYFYQGISVTHLKNNQSSYTEVITKHPVYVTLQLLSQKLYWESKNTIAVNRNLIQGIIEKQLNQSMDVLRSEYKDIYSKMQLLHKAVQRTETEIEKGQLQLLLSIQMKHLQGVSNHKLSLEEKIFLEQMEQVREVKEHHLLNKEYKTTDLQNLEQSLDEQQQTVSKQENQTTEKWLSETVDWKEMPVIWQKFYHRVKAEEYKNSVQLEKEEHLIYFLNVFQEAEEQERIAFQNFLITNQKAILEVTSQKVGKRLDQEEILENISLRVENKLENKLENSFGNLLERNPARLLELLFFYTERVNQKFLFDEKNIIDVSTILQPLREVEMVREYRDEHTEKNVYADINYSQTAYLDLQRSLIYELKEHISEKELSEFISYLKAQKIEITSFEELDKEQIEQLHELLVESYIRNSENQVYAWYMEAYQKAVLELDEWQKYNLIAQENIQIQNDLYEQNRELLTREEVLEEKTQKEQILQETVNQYENIDETVYLDIQKNLIYEWRKQLTKEELLEVDAYLKAQKIEITSFEELNREQIEQLHSVFLEGYYKNSNHYLYEMYATAYQRLIIELEKKQKYNYNQNQQISFEIEDLQEHSQNHQTFLELKEILKEAAYKELFHREALKREISLDEIQTLKQYYNEDVYFDTQRSLIYELTETISKEELSELISYLQNQKIEITSFEELDKNQVEQIHQILLESFLKESDNQIYTSYVNRYYSTLSEVEDIEKYSQTYQTFLEVEETLKEAAYKELFNRKLISKETSFDEIQTLRKFYNEDAYINMQRSLIYELTETSSREEVSELISYLQNQKIEITSFEELDKNQVEQIHKVLLESFLKDSQNQIYTKYVESYQKAVVKLEDIQKYIQNSQTMAELQNIQKYSETYQNVDELEEKRRYSHILNETNTRTENELLKEELLSQIFYELEVVFNKIVEGKHIATKPQGMALLSKGRTSSEAGRELLKETRQLRSGLLTYVKNSSIEEQQEIYQYFSDLLEKNRMVDTKEIQELLEKQEEQKEVVSEKKVELQKEILYQSIEKAGYDILNQMFRILLENTTVEQQEYLLRYRQEQTVQKQSYITAKQIHSFVSQYAEITEKPYDFVQQKQKLINRVRSSSQEELMQIFSYMTANRMMEKQQWQIQDTEEVRKFLYEQVHHLDREQITEVYKNVIQYMDVEERDKKYKIREEFLTLHQNLSNEIIQNTSVVYREQETREKGRKEIAEVVEQYLVVEKNETNHLIENHRKTIEQVSEQAEELEQVKEKLKEQSIVLEELKTKQTSVVIDKDAIYNDVVKRMERQLHLERQRRGLD